MTPLEAPRKAANELLNRCLAGESCRRELLSSAMAEDQGRPLFSVVVERLGDLFEPGLCDVYARMFAEVIELARPGSSAKDLAARYERVRRIRKWDPARDPRRVYVLSRVTLGADVAVTSVLIDAAHKRFPEAEIVFVGPQKNWELFAESRYIRLQEAPYARSGSLEDRLEASFSLAEKLNDPEAMVLDPDSRLTQLGLVPVCDEDRYCFFESRSYGAETGDPISVLASRWCAEVLGVDDAEPFVAPPDIWGPPIQIAVSLGVGENQNKRLGDEFEDALMEAIAAKRVRVLVDKGGSEEEKERVERVLRDGMLSIEGPFAPFATQITRSSLYVGYDSAGQHVAAAASVPLITIFAGFPSERFFERWRPSGRGLITVIRGDSAEPLEEFRQALSEV